MSFLWLDTEYLKTSPLSFRRFTREPVNSSQDQLVAGNWSKAYLHTRANWLDTFLVALTDYRPKEYFLFLTECIIQSDQVPLRYSMRIQIACCLYVLRFFPLFSLFFKILLFFHHYYMCAAFMRIKICIDVDVDEKYERRRGASLPASSIFKN